MPKCVHCGYVGPSIELRRLPLAETENERRWACKNKLACSRRVNEKFEQRKPTPTQEGML